jgi:hypothetical protein
MKNSNDKFNPLKYEWPDSIETRAGRPGDPYPSGAHDRVMVNFDDGETEAIDDFMETLNGDDARLARSAIIRRLTLIGLREIQSGRIKLPSDE